MNKIRMIAFLFVFYLGSNSMAVELESNRFDLEVESLKQEYFNNAEFEADLEEMNTGDANATEESVPGRKSPVLAFVLSAAVPGAGQFYNGSSIFKSLGFLAAEGLSWAGYAKWHADGNDLTDAYEAYANANWVEGTTEGFDPENPGAYAPPDSMNYRWYTYINYGTVYDDSVSAYTHHLPDTKTQQYYEMIGKYDQFVGGWQDYWEDGWDPENALTPMREHYEGMRNDANNKLNQANTMIYVAIINHLISAADAAVSANRHNGQLNTGDEEKWSLQAEVYRYSAVERIPMIKLTHKF